MKTCNDAPVGYTDHPPVGQWQGWNGGVCPVHPLALVEYVMGGGAKCKDTADQLEWQHGGIDDWDIIAYRIVEEYKAPVEKMAREVWIKQGVLDPQWRECLQHTIGAVLFREVIQ